MTSRMVFSAMLGAGVLLAPALSPQSAHAADDTKRYAGSGCNTLFSTDLVDRGTLSAILNSSTNATVTVVCPVIRDNTGTGSLGVKGGLSPRSTAMPPQTRTLFCDDDVRNAARFPDPSLVGQELGLERHSAEAAVWRGADTGWWVPQPGLSASAQHCHRQVGRCGVRDHRELTRHMVQPGFPGRHQRAGKLSGWSGPLGGTRSRLRF